ncbi:MAG TPA: cupin domain-containing protein [Opitutaceae bacterium]|nr:cupin domain-containing protein [Opitutaceae bacterium]
MKSTSLLPIESALAIHLPDVTQTPPAGIVSRTVLQSPEIRVVHFSFAEGQELTSHTNRRRVLVHVLDGECEFFFDGEWRRLGAGALLHLPPNDPHAVRASFGPFSMLLTFAAETGASSENLP